MLNRIIRRRHLPALAGAVLVVAVIGAGTATAASLVTSKDVKDGTLRSVDVKDGSLRVKDLTDEAVDTLQKGGATGAAGEKGATGPAGAQGPQGPKGDKGENGFNPGVLVAKDGDAGWTFTGAPADRFASGELRLGGGFDSNTTAGAIGISKAYDSLPLGSLSALSYTAHIVKRPDANSAPSIHVTVLGASRSVDPAGSGFTNLVFEPVNNGGTGLNQEYTFDALDGQWWSTKDLVGHDRQATASLASFVTDNPHAVIVGISLDNGGSSSSTIAVDDVIMGADGLVVGFGSTFDRYDFGG
jgi:hypothetical protein